MQYESTQLIDAVKEYIQLMKDSELDYFRLKNDKFEIELGEKRPPVPPMPPMPAMSAMPVMPMGGAVQQPVQTEAPQAAPEKTAGTFVRSPIVGTFYSAPAPGKAPFVSVGSTVNKGDVLFIIESMKLMNEVTSEVSGRVAEILVSDGDAVEFDQPILRIE